jgi:NADH-quinone oxidoreductase subunit L
VNALYWVAGVLGALMTAFYMFRALAMTFHGKYRGSAEKAAHVHESSPLMTVPLIILAILAFAGGWVGIPKLYGGDHALGAFLAPVFAQSAMLSRARELSPATEWVLVFVTTAGVIFFAAWALTRFARYRDEGGKATGLALVLENKWYVDEIYQAAIVKPLRAFSSWLSEDLEKSGFDGIVNGVGKLVQWGSRQLRLIQSGQVGFYIFGMVIGMVILLAVAFFV